MASGPTSANGGEQSGSAARVRLVAFVIFLGIGGLLAVVAVVAGGSDERDSVGRLRVELFPAPTGGDLVVYVQDQHNRPEVADNRSTVRLECADAGGAVLVSGSHRWPVTDTDGGTTEAHLHQRVPADDVEDVESCRLADTDPGLRGPVTDASLR
jgi:hypothetical protein